MSIPVSLVVALLESGAIRLGAIAGMDASGESGGARAPLAILVGALFTFFAIALVHAATARAVTEIDAGRPIGIARAYRLAVDRPRPLFGAVAISVVVVSLCSLSLLLIPVAVWLVVRWALIIPVAELEPESAITTLRRRRSSTSSPG